MTDVYDGDVMADGPAQTRELSALTIRKFAVDPQMSNNCFLLTCRATGRRILIDAAADTPRILTELEDGELTAVITTHQHWDHHRALAEVVNATGAKTYAGQADAQAISEQTGVAIDVALADEDTITFGSITLTAIHIEGHTPGSIALLYDDHTGHPHLFTGDSLFPGGVGATFGDSTAFGRLINDVEAKLFGRLPDTTWFYPGHGADGTLGVERSSLPEWRRRGW